MEPHALALERNQGDDWVSILEDLDERGSRDVFLVFDGCLASQSLADGLNG